MNNSRLVTVVFGFRIIGHGNVFLKYNWMLVFSLNEFLTKNLNCGILRWLRGTDRNKQKEAERSSDMPPETAHWRQELEGVIGALCQADRHLVEKFWFLLMQFVWDIHRWIMLNQSQFGITWCTVPFRKIRTWFNGLRPFFWIIAGQIICQSSMHNSSPWNDPHKLNPIAPTDQKTPLFYPPIIPCDGKVLQFIQGSMSRWDLVALIRCYFALSNIAWWFWFWLGKNDLLYWLMYLLGIASWSWFCCDLMFSWNSIIIPWKLLHSRVWVTWFWLYRLKEESGKLWVQPQATKRK